MEGTGSRRCLQSRYARNLARRWTYLPVSKEGEAIGESSVTMLNMPSKRRSGNGWVISAEIRAITLTGFASARVEARFQVIAYLVFPSCASATPASSPKASSSGRKSCKERPSRRVFSLSARRMNSRSLSDISVSRGILQHADSCSSNC